ncbi:MAG TPA: holdfast anchor protein HfaD [Hyphomonadaceae bacterium]|nr:holdfast anchor protein HfaD [Hyphomonadaceae bacterium]
MTAKIRLVTATALALLATPALAQTKSTAINDQLQWGDVFANINVVTRNGAPSATASAVAAGNSVSGANLTGDLSAQSTQTMTGATFGWANVDADRTGQAIAVATSQGNTLQAQTQNGDLDLVGAQATSKGDVNAGAVATVGSTRSVTAVASGAGNNAALAADHGDLNTNFTQTDSSSVYSVAKVNAQSTRDTVAGASAAGNAYGSTSTTSTVTAALTQNSSGPQVYASSAVTQDRARNVTSAATAAGNSASIENEWGYTQIRGRQDNASGVYSESKVALASWTGAATSSAYGVGNQALATNVGSDLDVDVLQQNTGNITTSATFDGAGSGDAVVASTAVGNAFTGYVCSYCGDARVSGSVTQTNGGNVASSGIITTNGSGAVIGSASAIGNTATFITTNSRN